MITLYEKNATEADWGASGNNGLCVLSPSSCIVHEIAGGSYELEMDHPMDEHGKYLMLTDERLIKAPVPKTVIPAITLPPMIGWKVTTQTDLYASVPVTTYKNKNWRLIQTVKANPSAYYWRTRWYYNIGSVVLLSSNSTVYVANNPSEGITPGTNSFYWTAIGKLSDAQPTTDATVIETLAVDTIVYKIADKGSYMQVRTAPPDSQTGYVLRDNCTETTIQEQETIPQQTITEQVFRIYETSCDETTDLIHVNAKHISYDFMSNHLYDCKVTEAEPIEAIAAIKGSLVQDDDRKIACAITGQKITQDWSFRNPINALLDPETGLVDSVKGKLIRNNNSFFILGDLYPRRGITIEYGVNMLGVNWNRSIENMVTKIIPRSGSSDKGYKYITDGGRISGDTVLDQGKNYVESPLADNYYVPRIIVLDCAYSEGQEYEAPDGTKQKYTEAEVLQKMKDDAKDKFLKDHVDGASITLDVEFLLLGDTEEYKQYRGLQTVCLYDIIPIKTGKSGIDSTANVTEYEFDSLRKRYNSIKLGTVNTFTKRVAGYRFVNGSITYEKLSPDLIDRIITNNASSTTDSGGAADLPGGGGVEVVNPNTKTTDGIVTKGQGQANKVWKTDADGNPDWRDEDAVPGVIDNLTSTSATDALSANQGKVLNGKITNLYTHNWNGNNVSVIRIGSICLLTIVVNSWSNNAADGQISTTVSGQTVAPVVPQGYKPNRVITLRDANAQKRIVIDTDGNITCTEKITSVALRFNATWITEDNVPS